MFETFEEWINEQKSSRPSFKAKSKSDKKQERVLRDTIMHPKKSLMGGPNEKEAEKELKDKFGYTDDEIEKLRENPNKGKMESIREKNEQYVAEATFGEGRYFTWEIEGNRMFLEGQIDEENESAPSQDEWKKFIEGKNDHIGDDIIESLEEGSKEAKKWANSWGDVKITKSNYDSIDQLTGKDMVEITFEKQ